MQTVTDLYTAVQREIGDQGSIFVNIDDVIRWANEGVVEIVRKAELENNVNTVFAVDEDTGTCLTGIINIEYLRIGDTVLQEVDFTKLESLVPGFDPINDRGQPKYYWLDSNLGYVNFYPKADADYTLVFRGTMAPTLYTAGANLISVALPFTYKYDLLRFVMIRANNRRQDHQSATAAKDEFNANIAMRYGEANSKSSEFDSIQPDDWDTPYLVAGYYGDL